MFSTYKDKLHCAGGKLAIMGGTFDPIHMGHLLTAEAARVHYGFDHVIFVPSGQPPHKDRKDITAPAHRYVMTILATMNNPHFHVSPFEVERKRPSYTIDTVKFFFEQYGDKAELFFITGADAMQEILTWKAVPELLETCQFIAAARAGCCFKSLANVTKELGAAGQNRIHCFATPEIDISSTAIRERLKENKSIKYLVPETVEQYIYSQQLYGCNGK